MQVRVAPSPGAPAIPVQVPLAGAATERKNEAEPPEAEMGIDSESNVAANLQIGPTSLGMVRLYVEAEGVELPLDFEPEEAEEIADELRAAAERARAMKPRPGGRR